MKNKVVVFSIYGQQDASFTFRHYLDEMTKEINSKSNEYILNVDVNEWKQYYIGKYDFLPLTLYPEKATVNFKSKGNVKQDKFGEEYEADIYHFEVKVPFTGWSFLFMLKPSNRQINHPRVNVPDSNSGFVTATFTLYEKNEQRFESEKKRLINAICANAPNINNDLNRFKSDVSRTFDKIYQKKKQKVLSEKAFFENINLEIERTTNTIFKVPMAEKKSIPEPIVDKKTGSTHAKNPLLPDKFYNDILDVIYKFFKSVEKKPSTYNTKDEEGLRDYVLPTLETRYNNTTVTGETFNKKGKTDILIKYKDGTNLFVAECKFWKGEIVFNETIHQLFDRYITWRDSKVAIIFFVTNKDFSKVLKKIKESVKKHPYFLRDNGSMGESSFSYIFHFPNDKEKYVFTEIMAFHFI